jgi:hypothetical protein
MRENQFLPHDGYGGSVLVKMNPAQRPAQSPFWAFLLFGETRETLNSIT